jgi:hypothetical protein
MPRKADYHLLSLQSYPLLLKKASHLGKMFYVSPYVNDQDAFQTLVFRWDVPSSQDRILCQGEKA